MLKLKRVDQFALFAIGIFLFDFFFSYHTSRAVIVATSSRDNHWLMLLLTRFFSGDVLTVIDFFCWAGMGLALLFPYFVFKNSVKLKWASLLLYGLMVALINFNLYLMQLHYAYLGVLLVYLAFFFSFNDLENLLEIRGEKIHSKHLLLILFFSSFSIAGASKFFFADWVSGYSLKIMLARKDQFIGFEYVEAVPLIFFKFAAWMAGMIELLSLPLYLYPKTRKGIWIANLLLQVFIFITIKDVHNISTAMILILLFLNPMQNKLID